MTPADQLPPPRRLTENDLDDVCALLAASDRAVLGTVDFSPDDISADLGRDDLNAFGWYADQPGLQVEAQQPELAAYGWVTRAADSNQVEVDLYLHPDRDPALGHQVLAHLEVRAAELVADAGHAQPWLSTGAYRQDERTRGWLAAAGWEVGTTFTRMRIDLDDTTELGVRDPEVVLRRVAPDDESTLRIAHRISQESFAEHHGHVDRPWGWWLARLTQRGADFAGVVLATLADDREAGPVGILIGTRQFESDQDAGYVQVLGVLPAGRGRGVAKALLRDYFARSRAAGRVAVLLHVDVANVTGALRLYESVGMRTVLEIDAWAKGTRAAS